MGYSVAKKLYIVPLIFLVLRPSVAPYLDCFDRCLGIPYMQ
jgi:hypothetical protein